MHANLSSTDTVVILTYLRGMYDQCLGTGHSIKYNRFSPSGTLTSTLTEVGTAILKSGELFTSYPKAIYFC